MAHLQEGPERSGAVIAVKDLSRAKTRLTSLSPALRGRLAALMAVTVARALRPVVDRVVVVTTAPGIGPLLADYGAPVEIVPDPRAGLNAAFEVGTQSLRAAGCAFVIACMADLPALTPDAVRAALAQCQGTGRWFVRDAAGTGTTLLAGRGAALDPRFGPDSAGRHAASGALKITAADGLRIDVDGLGDLAAAAAVGVADPVRGLLDDDGRIGRSDTGVIVGPETGGWSVLTAAGTRAYAKSEAIGADLARPAPGQRVHLVRGADGRILHLWI